MATITSLGFSIFSTYNGAGVAAARRDINDLNSTIDNNQKALSKAAGGFQPLITAALAFGPALVPVAAGVGAVTAGLLASTTAAGVAGGIWGIAAKGAIGLTDAAGKASDNLKKQKEILAGLTPGTKAYSDQLVKVKQAQGELNAEMAKLSPVQQQYVKNTQMLSAAWTGFLRQTSGATLGPINTIILAIAGNMGKLVPVVNAVGVVAQRVANNFAAWASDGGLQRFVNLLLQYGVPTLSKFATLSSNLLTVLGDGFRAFLPLGNSVVDALVRGSAALAAWADGGGFQRFLAYVQANGPGIRQFFEALGGALKTVALAIADMGPLALSTTTIILRLIAAMPPPLIQAIAYAFIAVRVAMMGLMIVSVITTLIAAFNVVMSTAAFVGAAFGLSMGLTLGIFALIGIAIAGLIYGLYLLVTNWNTVWNGIKAVAEVIWNFLGSKWGWLVALLGPVGWLLLIAAHWSEVWNGIKVVAEAIWTGIQVAWQALCTAFSAIWSVVGPVLTAAWNAVWGIISGFAQGVWISMQQIWNGVCTSFSAIWSIVGPILLGLWNAIWGTISTTAQGIWTTMQAIWNAVCTAFGAIWSVVGPALSASWGAIWTGISAVAQGIWVAMQAIWNAVCTSFSAIWSVVGPVLQAAWGVVWNVISTVAQGIWTVLSTLWNAFVTNGILGVWNTISGAISSAWSTVWNAISAAAQAVWSALLAAWNTFLTALQTLVNTCLEFIKNLWNTAWTWIQTTAQNIWNAIVAFFTGAWAAFQGALNVFLEFIKNIWNVAWTWIQTTAQNIWNAVVAYFTGAWSNFQSAFNAFLEFIKNIWNVAWTWIKDTANNIWDQVVGFVTSRLVDPMKKVFNALSDWLRTTFWNPVNDFFTKTVPAAFDAAVKAIGKAWDAVKEIVRAPIQAVIDIVYNKGIVKVWNMIATKFGADSLDEYTLPAFATGGAVHGAGTGRSDSVLARVSHGEHIWTAREVQAAGGHGAVANMRSSVLGGQRVREGVVVNQQGAQFADGGGILGTGFGPKLGPDLVPDGIVGNIIDGVGNLAASALSALKDLALGAISAVAFPMIDAAANAGKSAVRTVVPGDGNALETAGVGIIDKIADTIKAWIKSKDVAPAGGGFVPWRAWQPGDEERVNYRGVTVNKRTFEMLTNAEKLFGSAFTALQGSYSSAVDASAGTHSGGGAVDVGPAEDKVVGAMRGSGFAAWRRTPAEGFSPHVHGIAVGDMELSAAAAAQVTSFMQGRNGLADNGPDTYSGGGAVGGSVQAYAGLAAQALAQAGIPASQLGAFLALMQAESSGNPNAINTTDSNAAAGNPSEGLMQVTLSTFAAYGNGGNILDPLSNMIASANYIMAVYGGIVPGSPYALGTSGATSGWHLTGERGPEWVKFRGGEKVLPNGTSPGHDHDAEDCGTHVHFDEGCFQIQGNATPETVAAMKNDLVPAIRMAVEAGVGKRRHG